MSHIIYNDPYRPTEIKIDSLGIGIYEDTLSNLSLTQTEYLIVGERRANVGANIIKTYGLIVDHQGIGVNTTLENRTTMGDSYAVTVDGDVYVSGSIIARGIVNVSSFQSSTQTFWNLGLDETENIFFPGKVTFGTDLQSQGNLHKINVVESADRNINHAQVSIQNNALSQLRVAIVGSSNVSPVIFNTPSNVPIEFHVGRDQSFFQSVYATSEVPTYTSPNTSPHICIDKDGDVGIRTNSTPYVSYQQRYKLPSGEIQFPTVNEKANLAVYGTTYTCNLLIWDYDSGQPDNLDSLYIRRRGVTLNANQIIPGDFAVGSYRFVCNLDVTHDLTVNGVHRVVDTLVSDNQIIGNFVQVNDIETNALHCRYDASFSNTVNIRGDLTIEGGLKIPYYLTGNDGSNYTYWCNVQFTVATPDYSNINILGTGLSTPGRLGVGINPTTDSVSHQFVVSKRDHNIYSLQVLDKSLPFLYKSLFVGHSTPKSSTDTLYYDGSVIFTTPASSDPDYNKGLGQPLLQNMYFFPGKYDSATSFSLDSNVTPTLNIHTSDRVGIHIFNPQYTFDVKGDINCSGSYYYNSKKVGIWQEEQYANIYPDISPNPTFLGLRYSNPLCSNVGINRPPDPRFALSLNGTLNANKYYINDNDECMPWFSAANASSVARDSNQMTTGAFIMNRVGIGMDNPSTTLELKNYNSPTIIRMYKPNTTGLSKMAAYVEYADINSQWASGVDFVTDTFHIGYGTNIVKSSTANRAIWIRKASSSNNQVVINGNGSVLTPFTPNNPDPTAALTVNGNLGVLGDVRITGRYYMNGAVLINNNLNCNLQIPSTENDVFIAGTRIFMNPKNMLAVGYDATRTIQDQTDITTVFRVFQPNENAPVISKFICTGEQGFIEVASTRGQAARIGFTKDSVFSIMNKQNKPFFSFTSNEETGQNYMAFNPSEGDTPSANFHLFNSTDGRNMLKLTRSALGMDSTREAAEIELEKNFYTDGNTLARKSSWAIHGPDGSYQEKLAFIYRDDANNNEVLTIASNGCIGIGSTTPEYGIDIRSTTQQGSIRMLNTASNAFPQLVFQTGDGIYGGDLYRDFRFYTNFNSFSLDSADSTSATPTRIIHVASNNRMGLLIDADPDFDLTVKGSLNVKDGLYVNGYPILLGGSNLSDLFRVKANNIIFNPTVPSIQGGVGINVPFPTSNLFHVLTNYSANACVLDSLLNECQLNLRGKTEDRSSDYNVYRVAQSNQIFTITHNPNVGTSPYLSDTHDGYNNVIRWFPSTNVSGDYDSILRGSLTLDSITPRITMSSSVIYHSNMNVNIVPQQNLAIGDIVPKAKVHINAESSLFPGIIIQHYANSLPLASLCNATSEIVRINNNGTVGIGTINPQSTLHVIGTGRVTNPSGVTVLDVATERIEMNKRVEITNMVYLRDQNNVNCLVCLDSVQVPTFQTTAYTGFGLINNVLRYNVKSTFVDHGFFCDTNELMRLTGTGNLGIGTSSPRAKLDVIGSIMVRSNIVPESHVTSDIGTSLTRFKDIYMSCNVYVNGITMYNKYSGINVTNSNVNLSKVICGSLQIGNRDFTGSQMTITQQSPIMFSQSNYTTRSNIDYIPLLRASDTNCFAYNTTSPEALVHIVNPDVNGTMILDHTNLNGSCIFAVRNNGSDYIYASKTGNVGIGTGVPISTLHVHSSNTTSACIVQQTNPASYVANLISPAKTVVVDGTGNVGIGTTTPNYALHVIGQASISQNVYMGQNLEIQGNAITHGDQTTDSDIRLKTDLEKITNALDKVCELTGYTFNKIGNSTRSTGLVAQDVQKVLPECVVQHPDTDILSVAYGNMMGLIVEAIKDLKKEIDDLKKR